MRSPDIEKLDMQVFTNIAKNTAVEIKETGEVVCWMESLDVEINESRAILLATSSELLWALEVMVDHAQEMYPHFESERGQIDIAYAQFVIAKARGEV
jgi:hypothetical protein